MTTVLVIIALIFAGLVILSFVPGLDNITKPIFGMLFKLFEFMTAHAYEWFIAFIKGLFSAHMNFLKNLFNSPQAIDPAYDLKMEKELEKPHPIADRLYDTFLKLLKLKKTSSSKIESTLDKSKQLFSNKNELEPKQKEMTKPKENTSIKKEEDTPWGKKKV